MLATQKDESRPGVSRVILVSLVAVIVVVSSALVILGTSLLFGQGTSTSSQMTTSQTDDSAFFLQGNAQRVEALREWFMSPPNASTDKAGYDSSYGMVRGGFWAGGFQNGFVLIDSQLIAAKSLDYFNSLTGVNTSIESDLRQWLTSQFIDPPSTTNLTYDGNDRREIMFGKVLPCVMGDSGQIYYAPGHTLSDPAPITTTLPTVCMSDSLSGMNTYALWIELYYLQGNVQKAQTMFDNTITGWTSTPGTGIGGTTGGHFSDVFDSGAAQGKCKSSRALGYWIDMARATGFWSSNDQSKQVAQQVMNELWAHQLPDGGILVSYPGCGSDTKESPESAGLALVAFDPRVPSWFGHQTVSLSAVYSTSGHVPSALSLSVVLTVSSTSQIPRMDSEDYSKSVVFR